MKRRALAVWLVAFEVVAAVASRAQAAGRDLRFSYPAAALGRGRDVRVHLPASYASGSASGNRYPVVYLLHGFPGGSGDWLARAHAGEIADSLAASGAIPEVILVCPDGNHGFYGRSLWTDRWDGSFPLARSLVEDLVPWVDAKFRTRANAEDRAIIGLSDGATGGLALLRAHPESFSAWAGHSGDYQLTMGLGMRGIVGPEPEGSARLQALSPLRTIHTRSDIPQNVRLYLDCGRDDEDIEDNRQLHARLDSLGIAHTWHEFGGSHTWDYWRQHLHQSLTAVCHGMGESRDIRGGVSLEPLVR